MRIDRLTPEQEARMDEWADRWIEIGLRTGPADRPRFEAAVAECYRFAGLEPPRVVWCSSPLVAVVAGPIAASLLHDALGRPGAAVDNTVGAMYHAVGVAVGDAVRGAVDDAVGVAVGDAVRGAVDDAVGVAVGDAVGAVGDAVDAVDDAVRVAVRVAVTAVDRAVGDAVGAVDDAVRVAVDAVDAVDVAVRVAVTAVDRAVRGAVDAVEDAVRVAVRVAVGDAWWRYLGGQFWVGGSGWGPAWTSFFREVCGLRLAGDLWDRARAWEATVESACWWWPHPEFVTVSERPEEIHLEQVGPRGPGSHRLHREDGPAIIWPDGWGIWAWHGVRVPREVIETPDALTVDWILGHPNAEVRRAACERIGWDRFAAQAGLAAVDRCPDPANPGHDLALYDLPEAIFERPVRLLVCVNASPDRDGTRRRFGLTVPADVPDALTAAAWTFGIDRDTYAGLTRAT
jgi:hypothetical protein